jgi:hypothetical protein
MKAPNMLTAKDDGLSGEIMEKILAREYNENIHGSHGEGKYFPFLQGIYIALILSLFTLFIIRISSAQESFPKRNRPDSRIMDRRGTCPESLSSSLTEDQKKAIESFRRSYIAETRPIRIELFALKIHLRYLLSDRNVEPRVLFDQQKKISVLQGKLEQVSLSYQLRARSVLTKEQLERLPEGWGYELGIGHEIPAMETGRRSPKGLQ